MLGRRCSFFLIACLLVGCDRHDSTASGLKSRGRYAGIGTYDAGRLWQQIVAPDPKDPAAAKLADDEHVIVVLDSHTGEVRQCGDHSGYCVAMNPWSTGSAAAPVKLVKHAADLDAEAEASTNKAEPSR